MIGRALGLCFAQPFWFRIAVTDPGVCVTGMITPPLPLLELVPILKVQGEVLVNVQEWGCFSIFRRADDVTRTISKGGGVLVNVFTPPPSGNPVSAPG